MDKGFLALKFSGTGPGGKPIVVTAKADFAMSSVKPIGDYAVDGGRATTADEFRRLLQEKHPDVVVLGTEFRDNQRPLDILREYLEASGRRVGVIFHSLFGGSPLVPHGDAEAYGYDAAGKSVLNQPLAVYSSQIDDFATQDRWKEAILRTDPNP